MNKTEKINFLSDSYQIEGIIEYDNLSYPKLEKIDEFAIICHPHPMHGGTMNNKVVHSLIKACIEKNMPTLRFNFRGVGNSAGTFGNLKGEMTDLKSAIEYIKNRFNPKKIRLGGFSFGSYIALKTYCSCSQTASGIIYSKPLLVAPPVLVEGYDFEELSPDCALVVQGMQDDVVDEANVRNWVFSQKGEIDYVSIAKCDHFFHRRTVHLRNSLSALL